MTTRLRDILIQAGALAIAICLAGLARRLIGQRWELPIVVVLVFLALALVKARWPSHAVLSRRSWLYLAIVFVLFTAIAVLLSDFTILGYWTIPAAICLGLLYCVANLVWGPRGDDGRRVSR